MNTYRTYG